VLNRIGILFAASGIAFAISAYTQLWWLVLATTVVTAALLFVRVERRWLYAWLWHWWTVRRGTRRMLKRAERVYARPEPKPETPAAGADRPHKLSEVEGLAAPPDRPTLTDTVVLGDRRGDVRSRLDDEPDVIGHNPKNPGFRVISQPREDDALIGWVLNAIGLSILIILGVWLWWGGGQQLTPFLNRLTP
jgi:hypothetical protein